MQAPDSIRLFSPKDAKNGVRQSCFRRVVAVQGAVQLASALAAIRTSTRKKGIGSVENHLIVHDLSSPGDQANDFAKCLHGLARQAESWGSLHYFPITEILRFQDALRAGSWELATKTIQHTLGLDSCDELLLGQNLLFLNNLLARSFPEAEKACYGDGIGLNFTSEYYKPSEKDKAGYQSFGRSLERWFRVRIKTFAGKSKAALPSVQMKSKNHAGAFDKRYLLLANHFDQQLNQFEQLEAADFKDLFAIFAENLSQHATQTCTNLVSALQDASQVIVLLTSNFSETKRMSLEGEVACCLEMINRKRGNEQAVLIIKPHPRDSLEKIRVIETAASKSFRKVVTLADPWTFFLPFESIFQHYFVSNPRIAGMTDVVCSSSACVSLELLYGQHCELGFGVKNVRRHFAPQWQRLRERHELDLNRLIQCVRRIRSNQTAA